MASYTFDEQTARRMLAAVRWVETQSQNGPPRREKGSYRPGEIFVIGTADGGCTSEATCDCLPDLPASADNVSYVNAEGGVADGAVIHLMYDQRSAGMVRAPWSIIDEFVLTADLAHNGSGAATRTKCDGTAGDSYTIYDNGKIGTGYKFVTGNKLTAYYSTCGKWYWIAGPCRTAA